LTNQRNRQIYAEISVLEGALRQIFRRKTSKMSQGDLQQTNKQPFENVLVNERGINIGRK